MDNRRLNPSRGRGAAASVCFWAALSCVVFYIRWYRKRKKKKKSCEINNPGGGGQDSNSSLSSAQHISWRRGPNLWPASLQDEQSHRHVEEPEQQDTDRLQACPSRPLSERQCNLEGTMGKGQEKGGSIVPASCRLWLTPIVWPEALFSGFSGNIRRFPRTVWHYWSNTSEMRLCEYVSAANAARQVNAAVHWITALFFCVLFSMKNRQAW